MTDDGNRLKILLVDDEMLVRAGTAMMLDELGHEVTEAVSGKQALQIIADGSAFDVVMTDFRMPEMDGVALIAEVERVQPNASIVLMTGYEADDPRFESLRCTNLAKPFGLSELEEAIAASKAAS
jgi:YesN/AraC family two-component response regulator